MKVKNGFVAVKASKVKYDPEFAEGAERLPKTLTVEANVDFLDCLVEDDGYDYDLEEVAEYFGELIEEKVGIPVMSFEWRF